MSKQMKIQSRRWASVAAANASQTTNSLPPSEEPQTMDTTALIHRVTQNFSDLVE